MKLIKAFRKLFTKLDRLNVEGTVWNLVYNNFSSTSFDENLRVYTNIIMNTFNLY